VITTASLTPMRERATRQNEEITAQEYFILPVASIGRYVLAFRLGIIRAIRFRVIRSIQGFGPTLRLGLPSDDLDFLLSPPSK
jgi:hypothetical protein